MTPTSRRRGLALALATAVAGTTVALSGPVAQAAPQGKGKPGPSAEAHTGRAYDPEGSFTSKWTRADALRIADDNNPNAGQGANSLSKRLTMPEIPENFPTMKDQQGKQVWVWDTWPMTDERGNQVSYKGKDVIFSLVADPAAGYTFDDRHVNARIGYWYRDSDKPKSDWIYGGKVFGDQTPPTGAEWSGSTRIFKDGTIKIFWTRMDFTDRNKPGAQIVSTAGRINTDHESVWFTGLKKTNVLLEPDGERYQDVEQNPYFNFRDPFTFEDPQQPGKTFMVFEGNTAAKRGDYRCTDADLGDSGEKADEVTASGANYQTGNVGLAVAENKDLTKWRYLDPILSANCVNDQTERPQFVITKEKGKWTYRLYTISHQFTYAAGLRGPDGVYGFVGDGIRSDFKPMNSHGLALGNPTDLNQPAGASGNGSPKGNPRQYQAYSHYVMPGGLVESFIDNVDGRRGGTLAPTVKIDVKGTESTVDRKVGDGGLLDYGYIPSNKKIGNKGSKPDSLAAR